jgi:hypothetical protein
MSFKMKNQFPKDKRFHFWQQWLFYSSLLFSAFGLVLALYGNNPLFRPYHEMLFNIFLGQDSLPEDMLRLYTFALGPIGATIAGFYLLLAYVARYPFKQKELWARNAIVVAFGTWFISDAIVSFYNGVYFQILVLHLLVSVPQKALPLIFTWKEFK